MFFECLLSAPEIKFLARTALTQELGALNPDPFPTLEKLITRPLPQHSKYLAQKLWSVDPGVSNRVFTVKYLT